MDRKLAPDRQPGKTLVDQLYEKIQRAIASGRYRENDILPSIREMSVLAGVSEKVSRGAYRKLAEAGWVETRPHVGSVVSNRSAELGVRGRVLMFVTSSHYNYPSATLLSEMRSKMIAKGYRITTVSVVPRSTVGKYAELEGLLREKWDLVLEYGEDEQSRSMIERAGWPFVVIGNGARSSPSAADNYRGVIRIRSSRAIPSFVRQCVSRNVRWIIQFVYGPGAFDTTEMLKMPGIRTETVRIPVQRDLTSVANAAFQATTRIIRSGRLPDVILYTDDHLARGGLMALATSNVRVPEDVGVVTHVNKGFAPCWPVPLTCLSMDFTSFGRIVVQELLGVLSGCKDCLDVDLGSEWCEGETF